MADRIEQLEMLLEKDPADTFCLYGLAQEYAKRDQHDRAVEFYDKTLTTDPSYCYAYYHKARSLEANGEDSEAAETLRKGLAAAKECGDAHAISEISAYLDELS